MDSFRRRGQRQCLRFGPAIAREEQDAVGTAALDVGTVDGAEEFLARGRIQDRDDSAEGAWIVEAEQHAAAVRRAYPQDPAKMRTHRPQVEPGIGHQHDTPVAVPAFAQGHLRHLAVWIQLH